MVFIDSSVALAAVLGEDRQPAPAFWRQTLVASRLLEYEMWNRLHVMGADADRIAAAGEFVQRIGFVELAREVLERAREPFPKPIRTLDALHLTSCAYLRSQDRQLTLATYDERMRIAARALKIPLAEL